MKVLQEEPIITSELWGKFNKNFNHNNIRRTNFYKLINSLIKEGHIYKDRKSNKLYLTGEHIPITISYTNELFNEQYTQLENVPKGHIYFDELL